jgi:hypothetical protein
MFELGNYQISLNTNIYLALLGTILLALYSIYIYKVTIPVLNKSLKGFLTITRIFSLTLLFLLIFEPIITRTTVENIEPITYIFVDNSGSIIQKDSASVQQAIIDNIKRIESELDGDKKYFTFGKNINEITEESLTDLSFNEKFTDFEKLSKFVNSSQDNIANIILLTDGIITTGLNPLKEIEKKSIPYTVIGLGDSTRIADISVKEIISNNLIYSNKPTTIEAIILNSGFESNSIEVTLSENNNLLSSKFIELSTDGINRVYFEYTPDSPGEKKITINIISPREETNKTNNYKNIYKIVSDSKIKIGLVSDSPSPDLSIIKNSIMKNRDYELFEFITVDGTTIIKINSNPTIIDSMDILYLINFPTKRTNENRLLKVKQLISVKALPFFIQVSSKTDMERLQSINEYLPFISDVKSVNFTKSQLLIIDELNPLLLINSKFEENLWNNLPPFYAAISGINPRPESRIIANAKIKNIPTGKSVLLSRSLGESRCISLLGDEIWRWKINNNDQQIFDQFISNLTSWLTADPMKDRFIVSLSKKEFNFGEDINFVSELYDDKLSPIDNAEVSISLMNNDSEQEIYLTNNGNGIYSSMVPASMVGDLEYLAKATKQGNLLGETKGKITVNDLDIEKSDTHMNKEFLKNISMVSGGSYQDETLDDSTLASLNEVIENNAKVVRNINEYNLWMNEYILMIIILLFGIEWFIRKRSGMI